MACGSCGKSSWSGAVKTTVSPQKPAAIKPTAVPFKTGRIKTFFNKGKKG